MARMQMHKIAGVNLYDEASEEMMYQDSFEMAIDDAAIPAIAWPEPSIVRVFELTDGRLAIVRETAAGLSQEAAPEDMQQLFDQIRTKADLLVQKQQARLDAEQDDSQL